MSQRSAGSCTRCTRVNAFPESTLTSTTDQKLTLNSIHICYQYYSGSWFWFSRLFFLVKNLLNYPEIDFSLWIFNGTFANDTFWVLKFLKLLVCLICFLKFCPRFVPRTTGTQWRHKSKKSENLGRCGRQNMLRPYLICKWKLIFGCAMKDISLLGSVVGVFLLQSLPCMLILFIGRNVFNATFIPEWTCSALTKKHLQNFGTVEYRPTDKEYSRKTKGLCGDDLF